METQEIEKFAEGKKLNEQELDLKLVELKELNFITLEAILFVKINQKCGLQEATKIVVYSKAYKNG